ncbi:21 kDa protein-like [Rhododendron vialii]|uniref:21 kDa protein-like n=1 Tax=Rhododendron vialii TaxID=182163 RepID=UPI00265D629C|nr:21 kDa protein-like [Rhododendron vialii]
MTKPTLNLLPLILSFLYISGGTVVAEPTVQENFVSEICFFTHYPEVCVGSLLPHANAINESFHEVARAALAVSLVTAESAKANMLKLANLKGLKPMEYGALKDCIDQVDDGVDRLSQSVREMEHLGPAHGGLANGDGPPHGEESTWHGSNVETWTNAALSQVQRCAGGFSGRTLNGKIKTLVQVEVRNVEQILYNGLDLFRIFTNKLSIASDDV